MAVSANAEVANNCHRIADCIGYSSALLDRMRDKIAQMTDAELEAHFNEVLTKIAPALGIIHKSFIADEDGSISTTDLNHQVEIDTVTGSIRRIEKDPNASA